jgi:hypothetical protein
MPSATDCHNGHDEQASDGEVTRLFHRRKKLHNVKLDRRGDYEQSGKQRAS